MPEANVLFSVTAVVVVGLIVWVLVVLKTAKEPWARTLPIAAAPGDAAESRAAEAVVATETPAGNASVVPLDADSTARATPVALASERQSKADNQ